MEQGPVMYHVLPRTSSLIPCISERGRKDWCIFWSSKCT